MDSYTKILYILLILMCSITNPVSGETRCVERDRITLLEFRKGIVDDFGLLDSWKNSRDCCQWRGVVCNNATGDVVKLDLSGSWSEDLQQLLRLSGDIGPSLLSLSELRELDLSGNSFTRIPEFVGSFKNLQHLKLSNIELTSPEFPDQLGNLSGLQTLDLATTSVSIRNTRWLSRLSSLKYLNLSYIDLSESIGLLNTAIKLPSLVELQLGSCSIPNDTSGSFPHPATNLSDSFAVLDISFNYLPPYTIYSWLFNFSDSLTDINLSSNELLGTIPEAFGTITNLKTLDLTTTGIEGGVPSSFKNLSRLRELYLSGNNLEQDLPSLFNNLPVKSLQVLDLYSNNLTGSLPDFTTFTALTELNLKLNQLNGSFPEKFQQKSNLLILDLADNRVTGSLPDLSVFVSLRELYFERNLLHGALGERLRSLFMLEALGASSNLFQDTVSETHVTDLSRLVYLDLSYNALAIDISPDWSPSFQLDIISLSSCKLGSSFPKWLKTQKNFSVIDISNAGISDSVPDWFWESLNPGFRYLNLSSNQIFGTIPDLMSGKQPLIDMSSNNFSGNLPLFSRDTIALILNDNMLSGSISSLCNMTTLNRIDLSNNKLSGRLPNCWNTFESLNILNLEDNRFTGTIPDSMGALQLVFMMSMRGNRLTGEMPTSLKNCTFLQLLDLGENELSGKIPEWIDDSWSDLRVLSLPSNRFSGTIPTSICKLEKIQILDLSVNNISGSIPKCLGNFTGMTTSDKGTPGASIEYNAIGLERTRLTSRARYVLKALLQWKGRQSEYQKTLGLVVSLDLSSNRLTGEIPRQITSLLGLVALNLSRNSLTGPIPADTGSLKHLDFLDLSRNNLGNGIPSSLSKLSNLGVLDLSFNNLSGRIPKSTQLQSFDMSSYTGNPALCGAPLPNRCPGDIAKGGRHEDIEEDESDVSLISSGFYVSVAVGFGFGFWGLCGSLVLHDSWRHSYFEYFDSVKDKFL